jgi:hypothetical protein
MEGQLGTTVTCDSTHQVNGARHRLGTEILDVGHIVVVVLDANLLSGLPRGVVVQIVVRREDERPLGERHGGGRQVTGLVTGQGEFSFGGETTIDSVHLR